MINPNIRNKNQMNNVPDTLVNDQIRSRQVRLIDAEGVNQGVIDTYKALQQARYAGLDLFVINKEAVPPVAKILDYKKHLYEQKIMLKEQAKKNRENLVITKEIQLRPVTNVHDIQVKLNHAKGFLDDSNRVKIVVRFRGREMSFSQKGFEVIKSFIEQLSPCRVEKEPTLAGNSITAIVGPLIIKKNKIDSEST